MKTKKQKHSYYKCENYKCKHWVESTKDNCTDDDTMFYGCHYWIPAISTLGAFYRLRYEFVKLWREIKKQIQWRIK